MDAEIKQSVDSQLASKGLTKTDRDKPDLYIGYQTAINQEKQLAFGIARVSRRPFRPIPPPEPGKDLGKNSKPQNIG